MISDGWQIVEPRPVDVCEPPALPATFASDLLMATRFSMDMPLLRSYFEPHPEDEKLMEGTSFDAYREAVAQEGEMNRKKFLGQYDNPADEYALKTKSPVDSGPTEPISQWLRPK